jgi:hypothetical protein
MLLSKSRGERWCSLCIPLFKENIFYNFSFWVVLCRYGKFLNLFPEYPVKGRKALIFKKKKKSVLGSRERTIHEDMYT